MSSSRRLTYISRHILQGSPQTHSKTCPGFTARDYTDADVVFIRNTATIRMRVTMTGGNPLSQTVTPVIPPSIAGGGQSACRRLRTTTMTRQCLKFYPGTPQRMTFPYQMSTWGMPELCPLLTPDLRIKIRRERWPEVLFGKSALRTNYTTKGQAIKCYETTSDYFFKHTLLFNQRNMIGSDGRRSELPGERAISVAGGPQIEHGLIAQVQNTRWTSMNLAYEILGLGWWNLQSDMPAWPRNWVEWGVNPSSINPAVRRQLAARRLLGLIPQRANLATAVLRHNM